MRLPWLVIRAGPGPVSRGTISLMRIQVIKARSAGISAYTLRRRARLESMFADIMRPSPLSRMLRHGGAARALMIEYPRRKRYPPPKVRRRAPLVPDPPARVSR